MTTVINPNLIAPLEALGFTPTKALVYLTILKEGPTSVWEVAKVSGIKRPTCYAVLDELIAAGYASKASDGRRTIYSVISPRELHLSLERKQGEFRQSLSLLEGYGAQPDTRPSVRLYEGIEGVRQAFNLSLLQPEGSEVLVYGTSLMRKGENRQFLEGYIAERMKRKISARILFPDTKENRKLEGDGTKELAEIRYISTEDFQPKSETHIFGNLIVHTAHGGDRPFATVIESALLAEEQRQTFNILWKLAKP